MVIGMDAKAAAVWVHVDDGHPESADYDNNYVLVAADHLERSRAAALQERVAPPYRAVQRRFSLAWLWRPFR